MASASSLDILVLIDLGETPPVDQNYARDLSSDDWKNEAHVLKTLRELGHKPRLLAIHNDIAPLLAEVSRARPDLVFNMCEAFRGERRFEPNIAALLELLGLPYTGAQTEALALCKDKGLTKKILSYHRIHMPKFVISHRSRPLRSLKGFAFPGFIKPLGLEASEGISQDSFALNEKDALDRISFLHSKYNTDVILEEFIDGRELYVGIVGNDRPKAFRPRELFFNDVEDGDLKVATYKAKWDDAYRERWGIKTGRADPIDPELERRLLTTCKKIYRLLRLTGYARIDLRLKNNGDFVFIEANPNPTIARDEDFAQAAAADGLVYKELIKKIIGFSMT